MNLCSKYTSALNFENLELGRWVTTQRTFRRCGLLPQHRQCRLDAINFAWDLHSTTWHEYLLLLMCFRMHHGHTSVPYRYMVHVPPGMCVCVCVSVYASVCVSE